MAELNVESRRCLGPLTFKKDSRIASAPKIILEIGYRRMYETRHTFASWALGAGELPEWVARTLGHVDTSMVCRIYGRYISNLTRRDGSAFETLYRDSADGTQSENCGHNHGHNRDFGRFESVLSN